MKDLYVIGAGGHAKVIISLAKAANYHIAGIYDDKMPIGSTIFGIPVLGVIQNLADQHQAQAIIAIGNNATRKKIALSLPYITWATLIHPSAIICPSVQIGAGSVVMAGAVIQADTMIKKHVIINTMTSVDHDCLLEDYVHIAPGNHLAGNITLQEGTFSGVNAGFIPGVSVGHWSTIGAGAIVNKSIPSNVTAIGVPAKVVKEKEEGWQNQQLPLPHKIKFL